MMISVQWAAYHGFHDNISLDWLFHGPEWTSAILRISSLGQNTRCWQFCSEQLFRWRVDNVASPRMGKPADLSRMTTVNNLLHYVDHSLFSFHFISCARHMKSPSKAFGKIFHTQPKQTLTSWSWSQSDRQELWCLVPFPIFCGKMHEKTKKKATHL